MAIDTHIFPEAQVLIDSQHEIHNLYNRFFRRKVLALGKARGETRYSDFQQALSTITSSFNRYNQYPRRHFSELPIPNPQKVRVIARKLDNQELLTTEELDYFGHYLNHSLLKPVAEILGTW